MPSEQEHFFCIQKTNLLQDDESDRLCVSTSDITIEKSTFEPTISDTVACGLKNVKIELPRVNIPNEIMFKHEIDKYMKLFQCKEKPVEASFIQMDMNGNSVNYSEIYSSHNKSGLHYEEGLKTAKILNFSCTKCQNNIRYSPNDLQKHFQLLHQGELPSYPCEMCNFSANDFQSFNQHRRTHRSTLVKCEICNDDHRYTLLDLTKHFTSQHCVNGNFQCEKCRFSTQDVGTFVQHIHRHNEMQYNCEKCHHVSFSEEEFQKHVVSHTGTFPFICQYCNYMASRKNYLLRHIITLHKDHLYAKDKMNTDDNEKRVKNSTGLKLILKRYKTGASRKALWRRKKIATDGCRTEEDDVFEVLKESLPKREEIGQSVKELHDILLNEKLVYSGTKSSPAIQYNRAKGGLGSTRGLMKKAVHGPTVLMVKNNKISVPANYSAKFLGFKTVDGKQHIVIKLQPTEKQNLPGGNKFDGIKEGTAECQEETADNCNLPLVARSHEINNQMPRNNSVHLSTSPSSNQFSGKIKQESNVLPVCCNASQNIVPPIVMVEKCASRLPVKPETSSFPCDLMVKTRNPVSWKNCIPQDHPQVLSPSGSRMLHYDLIKKPFPPEFKVVNGEVNNNNKHNNLYCSSTEFSNRAPLPFHNYSKIGILEKSKELTYNKMYPLQSKPISESMPCFSQSVTELNLDKKSLLPLCGFVNGDNTPVFSASLPTHSIDKQCWLENHDGQLYLNTKVNQMLEHVAEKSKQENDSNCVNSSLMPKITSVFSLQSKQASTYLSPEINQSLQEVLKKPAIIQSNNYVKTNYDRSFSNKYTNCRTFTHNDLSPYCNLTDSSDKFKRELNMNNTARNESVYPKNGGQIPLPLRTEAINSASRKTSVGALLKTQTDSIITQQLVKDKMRYNIHGPSKICPFFPEQKRTVLQSTPSRFFVPLHLARKQGLQVISGRPSKVSSLDAQAARTASLLLNKRPGMILTFGRGSLGTAANAAENNSQVSEKIASKKPVSSHRDLQTNDSRSLRNSSINTCSEAVNASSIAIPQTDQHNTNPESRLSSVKILAGFQGSKAACAKSVKQPEVGQEQPVYALLPNGRQAVFLKCMSSNKSLVQNHSIFQGPTHSQSSEPKKHGAMQQKLFLKIKTFPAADKCQPVSNTVSSLQLNGMKCCNSPALNQNNTARPSSNALYLSGSLMPANACSANGKSKDSCSSVELVHSSRDGKTPLDSTQKETANTGNSLENQRAAENMSTQISKVKHHSKQNDAKVSNATVSQKNKNLKRKTKDDFQGPPRKKTLHRKCKEKNQLDVNEFESLFQTPYRPRASKDTIRILNLLPFHSKQLVKCPRRNQPVVVLNHPDADVPEVVNVMKTIAKFKGHVLKVSLSKRTIDALLEPPYYSNSLYLITNELTRRKHKMLKPVSPVKERFVLKLTLKKTSKNNYQIVKTTSDNTLKTKFSCWFCGRIFDNQDNWVGHGQRHLMEATRDWNSLE